MNRIITILLLFISSILFAQVGAKKYFEDSKKMTEYKEYEKALKSINIALKSDSLNRSYLLQKIKIQYFSNKCNDAMTSLNLIIENVDDKIQDDVMAYFCDIDDCLGKPEEATRLLKEYIIHEQYQNNEMILYLAIRLCNNKKYEEGINNYKQYINLNPNDIDAITDFSRIIYSYEGSEDGINEIKNSLQKNPNNIDLLKCLASFYNNGKDYEKAIEVQNQILKLNFTTENLKIRAILFIQSGKQEKAYDDYKTALSLSKCNPELYTKILQYEFDNKLFENVIFHSLDLVECNKSYESSILDGLYTSLFFCNDFEKGKVYLEKKLVTNPDTFNSYYLKSLILFKDKQYDNILKFTDLARKTKDIDSTKLNNINLLQFSYYLVKEDYTGFVSYWNSGKVKSLNNNLNFILTEETMADKAELETEFNKNTAVINTSLIIPTKVLSLLKEKYNLKLEINKK